MSPACRMPAVKHSMEHHDLSNRYSCRLTGQHRPTQRLRISAPVDECQHITDVRYSWLRQPRLGYRRVHRILLREGWRITHKHNHGL